MADKWPRQLTVGFVDAVAEDGGVLQNPTVMVWKCSTAPSGLKVLVLADGGSKYTNDTSIRFVLRGTIDKMLAQKVLAQKQSQVGGGGELDFVRGDLLVLTDYSRGTLSTAERYAKIKGMDYIGSHAAAADLPETCGLKHVQIVARMNEAKGLKETDLGNANSGGGSTGNTVGAGSQYSGSTTLHPGGTAADSSAAPTSSYGPTRRSSDPAQQGRSSPYGREPQQGSRLGTGAGGGGPIMRRNPVAFVRIADLNSFLGRWTIKARVALKGDIRKYSNARGEGQLFSCDLVDKDQGEIRCTFFNKAVDKFYPLLEPDRIYSFSRGQIRVANRNFNSLKHQYELQFNEDAEIEYICDDDPTIPKKMYDFRPIAAVGDMKKGDTVDIIGIPTKFGDIADISLRSTGQLKQKRDVTLVDQSECTIEFTLWGDKVHVIPETGLGGDPPVVAIKSARVDEYNGRRLTSLPTTQFEIDPDLPETQTLRQWWRSSNPQAKALTSLSVNMGGPQGGRADKKVTITEMRERIKLAPEGELEDRGVWFTIVGTLLSVDTDRKWFWVACPSCQKKIQQDDDAVISSLEGAESVTGFCNSCQKTVKPTRRYILNVEICDATGSQRCSCMGDRAVLLMGGVEADVVQSARSDTVYDTKAEGEGKTDVPLSFSDYFYRRKFREYVFRLQAKSELYMDERRIRYRLFGAEPINAVVETDAPTGPCGLKTCIDIMKKECEAQLITIYSRISQQAC